MSAITLFDLNGEQRFTGTSVGGGDVQPSSATATVTTDADDFYAAHTFDLGHVTLAYYKATVVTLTPDGETFGASAGDIYVTIGFSDDYSLGVNAGVSRDNSFFKGVTFAALHSVGVVAVNGILDGTVPVPRYVGILIFIGAVDTGEPYAGVNHPTAQVRLDVSYL